ncbi:MAG: hypothetical protein CMP08_04620 [Xanthomonadales bacterium]|nr:hypothetical protein [Xanthomonadales bacterium]
MPVLGCIADDFTGATDLASQCVAAGLRTVQMIGVPEAGLAERLTDIDAVVVALKSRTTPAADAVAASCAALDWLQQIGCRRFYFKYCSTFDSTPAGNIGPVTDALMAALGADMTVVCPALPANGRTIYQGYLFANGVLLNESGMADHPLTPMTDANLVRVMDAQTRHSVGLVAHECVRAGAQAVKTRLADLARDGHAIAVLDCIDDADLDVLGAACVDLALVTAGSGLALGLGPHWATSGAEAGILKPVAGGEAILSGSCSTATRGQIAHAREHYASHYLDVFALAEDFEATVAAARAAAERGLADGPVLIYASETPDVVDKAQTQLGREAAGFLVERAMGDLATTLVDDLGVRRLIVAGGETSGAVVSALDIAGLEIGPAIDTGVPWTTTVGRDPRLALTLKSGNFGRPEFMTQAWERMP